MKYNDLNQWNEMKEVYKEVAWQKQCQQKYSSGNLHRISDEAEPNSVFDKMKRGKIITRRYYGTDGKAKLDLDLTDHGNPLTHPIVPHAHEWSHKKGNPRDDERELTKGEKIANKEIL